MEEIINMSPDELYTKAIAFKQIKNYNNYSIYMTMAANYDHHQAINFLDDHDTEEIQKQDHSITFPFYERTKDFTYSSFYLAYMYHDGIGVEKNYQKAIELYMHAIEKGHACAMNNLAHMYYNGLGVEKNYQKAIELYMHAIEKEHAIEKVNKHALEQLTILYRNHKSSFDKKDIIDFFLVKYPDNLKTIFDYDSDTISYLQENYAIKKENQALKKINKELMDHINLSPGGTEYFEVLNEWKNKLQDNNK